MNNPSITPLEQALGIAAGQRSLAIGIPAPATSGLPVALTPQGAGILVDAGISVRMQAGAGQSIGYADGRYASQGVEITGRAEALMADVVLSLAPLSQADIGRMRRGATLMCLRCELTRDKCLTALEGAVTFIGLRLVADSQGRHAIADVLDEIAGRAAVIRAVARMASPQGKHILPGGVGGVVPCEAVVMGLGTAGCAAAQSAMGLGFMVRAFDNDLYRLRRAQQHLGQALVASAMHPAVLASALRTADVVVTTPESGRVTAGADIVAAMKADVIIIATSPAPAVFPSLPAREEALAPVPCPRTLLVGPQHAVTRTMAMALSNALVPLCMDIATAGSVANALRLSPGLAQGVLTYLGHPTHPTTANVTGLRVITPDILLKW